MMKFSTAALPKTHILQIDNRHVSIVVWREWIIYIEHHSLKWFLCTNSISNKDLS